MSHITVIIGAKPEEEAKPEKTARPAKKKAAKKSAE
jgi:hypothetical protein